MLAELSSKCSLNHKKFVSNGKELSSCGKTNFDFVFAKEEIEKEKSKKLKRV